MWGYPSLCFILPTSVSLTTLVDTRIIFRMIPGSQVSKSLNSITRSFSIKFSNETVFTTVTSYLHIQIKSKILSYSMKIICSLCLFSFTEYELLLSFSFEAAKECIASLIISSRRKWPFIVPQTEVLSQMSGVNDNNIPKFYWSHRMFKTSLAVCGRLV